MFGFSIMDAVKVGAGIAVASAVWLAYNHYTGILEDREAYRVQASQLERALVAEKNAVNAAREQVEEWRDSYESLQQDIQSLADASRAARTETRRLQRLFAEHDLNRLALERPDLVASRVNAGSSRINRLLECASGAESGHCAAEPSASDGSDSPGAGASQPDRR